MATFYVIPPRECYEQAFQSFLNRYLPGMAIPGDLTAQMLENLQNTQACDGGCYLVHREDLSGQGSLAEQLRDGFGAEPGDVIVDVALPVGQGASAQARRSIIHDAVSDPAPIS